MNTIKIDVAENGFIAYEYVEGSGMKGKCWAFESAQSLSEFIREWGDEKVDSPVID